MPSLCAILLNPTTAAVFQKRNAKASFGCEMQCTLRFPRRSKLLCSLHCGTSSFTPASSLIARFRCPLRKYDQYCAFPFLKTNLYFKHTALDGVSFLLQPASPLKGPLSREGPFKQRSPVFRSGTGDSLCKMLQ